MGIVAISKDDKSGILVDYNVAVIAVIQNLTSSIEPISNIIKSLDQIFTSKKNPPQ